MSLRIIPDVVSGLTIQALQETSTVQQAAQLMVGHNISAVVVLDARVNSSVSQPRGIWPARWSPRTG